MPPVFLPSRPPASTYFSPKFWILCSPVSLGLTFSKLEIGSFRLNSYVRKEELWMFPILSLESLSPRMPFVAKENETDVLAGTSNVSCQTRGELVFSLEAAKEDRSQPISLPGKTQTHGLRKPGRPALLAASLTRISASAVETGCSLSLHLPHAFHSPWPPRCPTPHPAPHHPCGLAWQARPSLLGLSPLCPKVTCVCVCGPIHTIT